MGKVGLMRMDENGNNLSMVIDDHITDYTINDNWIYYNNNTQLYTTYIINIYKTDINGQNRSVIAAIDIPAEYKKNLHKAYAENIQVNDGWVSFDIHISATKSYFSLKENTLERKYKVRTDGTNLQTI